ncbi:MAG: class I SAM-dependent methyltransferase, partial [Coriobacteriales bacterium]|nr:class I SAM-dependent methyltransferase [Coriobacteriales bacterium]
MDAALACRPLRIVVKRPLKAPALAGRKPSHSVEGKTIRYDVIVPTR